MITSGEGAKTKLGPPSIMMTALRIPKPSLAEAPLVPVLSSSSEDDDHDIGFEPAPYDVSKFSHVTEEKMQATAL